MLTTEQQTAAALDRSRTAMRDWVFGQAFPFWSKNGFGPAGRNGSRGAAEQLSLDGVPDHPGFTRMRVQARQLYVFSIGAENAVPGAAEKAEALFRFILQHGRVGEGGWARRLEPDGAPHDPTADLYDIAFVLFALAHHARVSGQQAPLVEADRTLGFIRRELTHPAGGFRNTVPVKPGWRQQNPHMHLLEASHALVEAGAGAHWGALAEEMVSLFHGHFFDRDHGTLAEFFTEELARAGGIDGDSVEPGHQVEWIWLLDRHEALFGGLSASPAIRSLARVRDGQGVGDETGLMRDEIARDGRLLRGSSRLWPQTELLRAGCVLHRRAETDAERADAIRTVLRSAENVMGRYLVGADSTTLPPGTWIDQLDAFGRPAVKTIPTSSFYHILTAWTEFERFRPFETVPLSKPAV